MRTTALSLTVIAVALAAIVAGYASGEAGARPPQVVTLRPIPSPSVRAVMQNASDGAVLDLFSDDDVVVDRPPLETQRWLPERLSIVIGLCGRSAALDGQFLSLGLPLAVDLDPHGADAQRVARYVTTRGLALFIHVTGPPSVATIRELESRFGHLDGVAARSSSGMADALRGTGLMFFDERGDAAAEQFHERHVAFARRDTTVDDRSSPAYITFMLERAALRSRRQGRVVTLMSPLPNTLGALIRFMGTRSAQIVALTQPT